MWGNKWLHNYVLGSQSRAQDTQELAVQVVVSYMKWFLGTDHSSPIEDYFKAWFIHFFRIFPSLTLETTNRITSITTFKESHEEINETTTVPIGYFCRQKSCDNLVTQ